MPARSFHVGFSFARFRDTPFPIIFIQLIHILSMYKVDVAKVDVVDAIHVVMVLLGVA
jgi:hypothetical protein